LLSFFSYQLEILRKGQSPLNSTTVKDVAITIIHWGEQQQWYCLGLWP